jgi:hypothetical protein
MTLTRSYAAVLTHRILRDICNTREDQQDFGGKEAYVNTELIVRAYSNDVQSQRVCREAVRYGAMRFEHSHSDRSQSRDRICVLSVHLTQTLLPWIQLLS